MVALPIASYRDQILAAIRDHQVVIIEAETGAGKSTQVPQYLLAEGLDCVVTQPRRLAAQSVARRVADEIGETVGRRVGFRTSQESCDSAATRCLFCTDGLALVRGLMGARANDVLIIDEVHEWNLNIEVLVAWAKYQLSHGAGFKLVLMSATMEVEALAAYFPGCAVISVPGRPFTVREVPPGPSIAADAARLLKAGRSVLVFQPGKADIDRTIRELESMADLDADILPLHADLVAADQARCFKKGSRPVCIIATDIAQSSLTIPFIDAVVDSGLEKRVELVDGVEGLYIRPISFASREQRKGRAGRVRDGIYIDHCPEEKRLAFPRAEILDTLLDQTVLRLAKVGIDMEQLEFFHQPDSKEIHQARETLRLLGCLDHDDRVTPLGDRIALLPVSVRRGRMLIEAEKLGVVEEIIVIAAIMEAGEITSRNNTRWLRFCQGEDTSEALAQLAVFHAAQRIPHDSLLENGINAKSLFRAENVANHLIEALTGKIELIPTRGTKDNVRQAICAGLLDHLYQVDARGRLANEQGVTRRFDSPSVITSADWLVGQPWDMEVGGGSTKRGIRRLLRFATRINPIWLTQIAPHLTDQMKGLSPFYDPADGVVKSITAVFFNGREIINFVVPDPNHPQAEAIRQRAVTQGSLPISCVGDTAKPALERDPDELDELMEQAQSTRQRLIELYDRCTELEVDPDFLYRFEVVRYSVLPRTASRLEIWLEHVQPILTVAAEMVSKITSAK